MLAEYFVRKGNLTKQQAEKCINKFNKQYEDNEEAPGIIKKSLGEIFIEDGYAAPEEIAGAFYELTGSIRADLDNIEIDKSVVRIIPEKAAFRYGIIAFKESRDQLFLAMKDVTDLTAIETASYYSRKKIRVFYGDPTAVNKAILEAYGRYKSDSAIKEMTLLKETGSPDTEPENAADEADIENSATIKYVNSLINRAVAEGASDIHIEPSETETVTRIRVDGILRDIQKAPISLHETISARIKIMGNMDVSQKRIPQDGRTGIKIDGKAIDLRISTLPAVFGEKIVIRILRKTESAANKNDIGLSGDNAAKFEGLLKNKSGVILIAGPTGSGKSTTMMTMIRELNSRDINIISIEDPVEYNIEGISQIQINEKAGLTFAAALRAALRQDPDIICIGEIRDRETAEIAMRAAITGHLVISTIHTSDAPLAIERLKDMGVENYLISSAVKGVVGQRLVRRLCEYCKEKRNGYYVPAGCSRCYGSGYKGRTGVFEIMPVNRELSAIIRNGAGYDEILSTARKQGFSSMYDEIKKKTESGETSFAEAERVLFMNEQA